VAKAQWQCCQEDRCIGLFPIPSSQCRSVLCKGRQILCRSHLMIASSNAQNSNKDTASATACKVLSQRQTLQCTACTQSLCCWQMHDSHRTSRWESPPPPPTLSKCMLTARDAGRHTVPLIVSCPVPGTKTDQRNSAQLYSTEKSIH
jgi:hypothetical protein